MSSTVYALAAALVVTGGELPSRAENVTTVMGEMPEKVTGPLYIRFCLGGHLPDNARKVRVTFDGPALSACTLLLLENRHVDTCYTRKAVFATHEIRDRWDAAVVGAMDYHESLIPEKTRKAIGPALFGRKLTYFTAAQFNAMGIGRFCQ